VIKAYSQRLMPPYSGQMQIVETERARALTLDCQTWEIQFLHSLDHDPGSRHQAPSVKRSYMRVATLNDQDLRQNRSDASSDEEQIDERMLELTNYLQHASLPFPAADIHEFWLLDVHDQTPLALVFSCTDQAQMQTFPERAEWTALPAAVMPIERSQEEKSREYAPINYQLERRVAERAGFNPKGKWFTRKQTGDESFPALMLTQDWQDSHSADLCQRYLKRQSPRLLMLHGLSQETRRQLEINARPYALEVERFHKLYPEIVDQALIDTIRVEAKLRSVTEEQPAIHKRRDGIHYL